MKQVNKLKNFRSVITCKNCKYYFCTYEYDDGITGEYCLYGSKSKSKRPQCGSVAMDECFILKYKLGSKIYESKRQKWEEWSEKHFIPSSCICDHFGYNLNVKLGGFCLDKMIFVRKEDLKKLHNKKENIIDLYTIKCTKWDPVKQWFDKIKVGINLSNRGKWYTVDEFIKKFDSYLENYEFKFVFERRCRQQ